MMPGRMYQFSHAVIVLRNLQIEESRKLPVAGVDVEGRQARTAGTGNMQHLGALRGQCLGPRRTGDHMGAINDLYVGKRAELQLF